MDDMEKILGITVEELKSLFDSQDRFLLLDVREDDEFQTARIHGAVHVSMSKITQVGLASLPMTLDVEQRIIVQCHHGGRSAQVAHWLVQQGFSNVWNLLGGIDAWSLRIDNKVPRY